MSSQRKIAEHIEKLSALIRGEYANDSTALRRIQQLRMRLGVLDAQFRGKKVSKDAGSMIPLPHGLSEAPELYKKRQDKAEGPIEFLRRVYGDWLGKGLGNHHLRILDHALYAALTNWLGKNEMPADIVLPSKKEMIDAKIAREGKPKSPNRSLRISQLSPKDRDAVRVNDLISKRAKREKK